ncbi:MAG: hypothetical protein QN122_06635 [Armatimonadota bacterium]|nr:hypothetical protein [Armatimonadota bacterium]MDR7448748.1 hypothetical protein [Armatimonadota bacterium]MDR7460457.1 hypothetical protein [Armatimonadota bacterium]MDR7479086.1 hypothetical protein [Armatimonadota bacterium]MDR7489756.1 hypothetical protein [Armatimonadota bacterium]
MRIQRDRELARQRHRREKVRRLLVRIAAARGEERERLLTKLQRIAPWRLGEARQGAATGRQASG